MTNIGIYCPKWLIAKHNTDYKIIKEFSHLSEFSDVRTSFISSESYTWTYNLNKIVQRVTRRNTSLVLHSKQKLEEDIGVLYHYSSPINPALFFNTFERLPIVVATGFMTDQYMFNKVGELNDRQKEADVLAKKLERASMIHFHTENGRQRFLMYRPEFKERTISIPFFLSNLGQFQIDQQDSENTSLNKPVNVLFVGNEGYRKGLNELIEAFDILGSDYLNAYNVHVTVVSKDKPLPKSRFNLTWHTKSPHKQVIELMKEASIFVLVPKRESYGIVLVEAMMANCAIITDDDDTRKEILGDTGIVLPSGKPDQIANSLKILIEDNKYRLLLGKKAFERAKKTFLPEIVAKQYETCFKSITNINIK